MALRSTQTLTEMSTRDVPGGKGRPARKADNLIAICEPIIWNIWELRRLTTPWASMAYYRDSFTFYLQSLLFAVNSKKVSYAFPVRKADPQRILINQYVYMFM
jgi:hypothetical protein